MLVADSTAEAGTYGSADGEDGEDDEVDASEG